MSDWNSDDWLHLGLNRLDSDDWLQIGLTAGGIALGGVGGALAVGAGASAAATTGAIALGAGLGGASGWLKGEEIETTNETNRKIRKAQEAQDAKALENEKLRKQSLLAAHNTMTAREAMARNVNAAIRNMYSPKTKSNNPTPYMLGGDEETLG